MRSLRKLMVNLYRRTPQGVNFYVYKVVVQTGLQSSRVFILRNTSKHMVTTSITGDNNS